jgi:glutamyl-tRNA synthetase
MSDKEYLTFVKKFITFDSKKFDNKYDDVLLLFKNQISYAAELNQLVNDLFFTYDTNIIKSFVAQIPDFSKNIKALEVAIKKIPEITIDNGNAIVEEVKAATNLKGKDLFMPIRLIAVAKEHGPEMNKILALIGKKKMLILIANFLKNNKKS